MWRSADLQLAPIETQSEGLKKCLLNKCSDIECNENESRRHGHFDGFIKGSLKSVQIQIFTET